MEGEIYLKCKTKAVVQAALLIAGTAMLIYGAYRENLRLCFLPVDEEGHGYWFGFESEIQKIKPVFKAKRLP